MDRTKGRERGYRMNRRQTGTAYERRAGEYLKEQGYELIGYNFRCRQGEIDIIARDGRYLVFVEVKIPQRRADGRSAGGGGPGEAAPHQQNGAILLPDARIRGDDALPL